MEIIGLVLFLLFAAWLATTVVYGLIIACFAWYYAWINRDGWFRRSFWVYVDMVIDDIIASPHVTFWHKFLYGGYWICAGPITLVSKIW